MEKKSSLKLIFNFGWLGLNPFTLILLGFIVGGVIDSQVWRLVMGKVCRKYKMFENV